MVCVLRALRVRFDLRDVSHQRAGISLETDGGSPPPSSMFPGRMALSPPSLLCGPPEELQELAFTERPIRRTLKTAEEIDQLTVDEGLNEVERAVYLLSQGQEMQRACVISNLPSLVRQNPAETFRRVVPKIREVLNGAGVEIQLAAAASFLTILQDDIILIHTHTYSILKTVLQQLNHRDTGSPDPMSCPAIAALIRASSHTSVLCARRSSPAATIYPNIRRSTAAPGPAGLSEPPCDARSRPEPCPERAWTRPVGSDSGR